MKNKYIRSSFISLLGSSLLLISCQEEMDGPESSASLRPLTTQEAITVENSNNFAFKAFGEISKAEESENVFISPLSLSTALAMTYNGAGGETKEAIKETLGFALATDEEINQSFKSLSELLIGIDKKVQFSSANSIWYNNQYQLQDPFVQTNQTYYDATIQGLNFSSPTAKDQINNWVENKTNGKIKEIVKEVLPRHAMFLINAIYFKGTWTYLFDKELTKPAPFHLEDGNTMNHDFMVMNKGKYLLYQDDSKTLVDLPYGNGQFSMTIVMPNGEHKVGDVVQELSVANLESWLAAADTSSMELHMPKFKLEYEKELQETLSQLGMGVAFSVDADFSHMLEGQGNLTISKVKQKTFIEVNEEGTEAAAATSVEIIFTSLPPSLYLNKPFIFLIREKSSKAILFIGKLMQPQ